MYKSYSFATFVRLFFQPSLMRPQTATFTKTTSAKRISTSSFKVKEGERLSKSLRRFCERFLDLSQRIRMPICAFRGRKIREQ